MSEKQWAKIFKLLERHILDRKGIKREWDQIERSVALHEIRPAWLKIVNKVLEEAK